MISQLGYVGVGASDTKPWEDFAENILGMEISEKLADGTLYLRMDEYHHRIIVEPTGEDDITYAGWMASSLDELAEVQSRVQAAGVKVEEGTPEECAHRKVHRFITFPDPDGLRVEVFWGLGVNHAQRFDSPRGLSPFLTGKMGLGHINISVKDVDGMERFYRDVLGFKISDYIMTPRPDGGTRRMVFTHVNPRHHSLAFAANPTPRRLNHWMMETTTLNDLGKTYDLVKQQGVPVTVEMGRHINDHMVSFYMTTPSNFSVEYGWDGRQIDDNDWVVEVHHNSGNIWGHEGLGGRRREAVAEGSGGL